MAGRKPKPTKIKALKGTLRKCRTVNEPEPDVFIPQPPKHLDEVALEEWNRITSYLHDLGLISELDMAKLAGYCNAFSRWVKAETALKKSSLMIKTKNGNLIQSPLVGIANKAWEMMHKAAGDFGMSPVDRTRIDVKKRNKTSRFKVLDEAG